MHVSLEIPADPLGRKCFICSLIKLRHHKTHSCETFLPNLTSKSLEGLKPSVKENCGLRTESFRMRRTKRQLYPPSTMAPPNQARFETAPRPGRRRGCQLAGHSTPVGGFKSALSPAGGAHRATPLCQEPNVTPGWKMTTAEARAAATFPVAGSNCQVHAAGSSEEELHG